MRVACLRRDRERDQRERRARDDEGRDPPGHLAHRRVGIVVDLLDRDRAGLLEQPRRRHVVEPAVGGLDAEHERVVGDVVEALVAEQRVPDLRQPVQDPHPEEAGEHRDQDRALERDRHVGRDRPRRLAGDVPRPVVGVAPPLQEQSAECAEAPAAEDQHGQDGAADPHRVVDAVHRERAEAIELGVARVADLAGCFDQCKARQAGHVGVVHQALWVQ